MTALALLPLSPSLAVAALLAPPLGACLLAGWLCARVLSR
jgi:hypothetical protein